MPRSLQEIIDNRGEYARFFEEWEPDPDSWHDARPLGAIIAGVKARAAAEEAIADAVAAVRENGISWGTIGSYLGTTGEAARQWYGSVEKAPPGEAPAAKASPAETLSERRPKAG